MIDKILIHIAEGLDDYLGNRFEEPSGLAKVGEIGAESGGKCEDKMMVALLNIEREGAMGTTAGFQSEGKGFIQKMPPWYLNMFFVVAAVFDEKRYLDGLRMLTASIAYLQQHPVVIPEKGKKFTVEPVSLGIQELTNVWSIFGGKYYPSVVCKVRMLRFEGDEIHGMAGSVRGL